MVDDAPPLWILIIYIEYRKDYSSSFSDVDAIDLILLWFVFLSALSTHTYLLYASGWESFIQLAHNITWWMAMEQISSELCVNGRISIGWYLSVSAVPKLSVGVHSIGSPDWCVQISISPIFGSDGGMPTTQVASDLWGGGVLQDCSAFRDMTKINDGLFHASFVAIRHL